MSTAEGNYDGFAEKFVHQAIRRRSPEASRAFLDGVRAASVSEMERLRAIDHPAAHAEADAIARELSKLADLTGQRN